MKLEKKKKATNFIDRTGTPIEEVLNQMLFSLLRQNTPPGELLKTQDHRFMMVDPVLNIAHDPFKVRVKKKSGY